MACISHLNTLKYFSFIISFFFLKKKLLPICAGPVSPILHKVEIQGEKDINCSQVTKHAEVSGGSGFRF